LLDKALSDFWGLTSEIAEVFEENKFPYPVSLSFDSICSLCVRSLRQHGEGMIADPPAKRRSPFDFAQGRLSTLGAPVGMTNYSIASETRRSLQNETRTHSGQLSDFRGPVREPRPAYLIVDDLRHPAKKANRSSRMSSPPSSKLPISRLRGVTTPSFGALLRPLFSCVQSQSQKLRRIFLLEH
jgi:hypothetical protein